MKKQTAVEWLVKIYLQTGKIDSFDIEQAKTMEKEQIIDAHLIPLSLHHYWFSKKALLKKSEQYYIETYTEPNNH
jgi:hypothetical protein